VARRRTSHASRSVLHPKSGGGKAERFDVAGEARSRGIEPVELQRDDDLGVIVRDAIARGADAVGMAGGDGSQAVVAAIAAEHGLPYVCVPAGTRNHFALDLGVDRDDVVGALDAFTKGGERVVDLAEVNERVFVNNVSLGVYAEADRAMVRAIVRARIEPERGSRDRWRGGPTRASAAVPHSPGGAARPDRPPPSRRFAIIEHADGSDRRDPRAGARRAVRISVARPLWR
jgi:hypothetical protein